MDNVAVYQAKETLDIAHEISKLLDCGLDKESLAILIALCENGVNPCLLYTSPSPRDKRQSRMPSSA